ncbi:MAG: hypothetical protein ACFB13_20990 [Kiloniellaceae bacterium]
MASFFTSAAEAPETIEATEKIAAAVAIKAPEATSFVLTLLFVPIV